MEDLLKNQHDSMATVVETFIVNETAELIYDGEQLEKWNKYVEELGLSGQTQIVKKDKSPIPFMPLKKNLENVLKTLCPRAVDVTAYNRSPIPMEILDLIALSKNEGYFEKMQIWYDDVDPDPVCVGMNYAQFYSLNQNGNFITSFVTKAEAQADMDANGVTDRTPYAIGEQYWLLGKWADVKRSFSELTEMATKRFIKEKGNSYRKAIKEAQRGLDDLEIEAFDKFGDNSTSDVISDLPF